MKNSNNNNNNNNNNKKKKKKKKKLKIDPSKNWYMHNPELFLEKETRKFLLDF